MQDIPCNKIPVTWLLEEAVSQLQEQGKESEKSYQNTVAMVAMKKNFHCLAVVDIFGWLKQQKKVIFLNNLTL